jgi:hypothetical protein
MTTETGKCSWFGGPKDTGVAPSEGLALFDHSDVCNPQYPGLFLPSQPAGTTGVARRLNPDAHYIAMRWNYSRHPKAFLRESKVRVTANGRTIEAQPVDWGPNQNTGRVADLSPGLLAALGLETDDTVTIEIPDPEDCSCSSGC